MIAGNNKRAAMDWFDRKVLQYVLFWDPAGGMDDEDVFPEFGMRVDQLNERFNSIISTLSGCSSNIDDTSAACGRSSRCRRRFRGASGPRPPSPTASPS